MATIAKFYFHDAATPNTGTMPTAVVRGPSGSTVTDVTATGARTARDATDTIGAANPDTESSLASIANQLAQDAEHRRFVSRPLAAQTLATFANWTFSYARSESSLNHNQSIRCTTYVWNPTGGAIRGSQFMNFTGTEPGVAATEETESVTGVWTVDPGIQDGDILVFDVISRYTQSHSSSYTDIFCYDGTTEASATTCATFIQPDAPLTLAGAAADVIPDIYTARIRT